MTDSPYPTTPLALTANTEEAKQSICYIIGIVASCICIFQPLWPIIYKEPRVKMWPVSSNWGRIAVQAFSFCVCCLVFYSRTRHMMTSTIPQSAVLL